MTALTRRYPCLYTTEARKHARNQRRLDGWLVVHHHNCSSTLWDEERRSQLRFGWLKAHPRRKVWDNGIGGLKCDFKLQEDEEIQLGDSHKVWITGGPVEESFQVGCWQNGQSAA